LAVVPLLFFLAFMFPTSTPARSAIHLCHLLYTTMDLVEAVMAVYLLDSESSLVALFMLVAFVPLLSAGIQMRLRGFETVWDKLVYGVLSEVGECWFFMFMAGTFVRSGDDVEDGAATFLGNGTLLGYSATESRDLAEHVFPAMCIFQIMALMIILLKESLGDRNPFKIAIGQETPAEQTPTPLPQGATASALGSSCCGFGAWMCFLGVMPLIVLNFGAASDCLL
jgi:hypothetical protein